MASKRRHPYSATRYNDPNPTAPPITPGDGHGFRMMSPARRPRRDESLNLPLPRQGPGHCPDTDPTQRWPVCALHNQGGGTLLDFKVGHTTAELSTPSPRVSTQEAQRLIPLARRVATNVGGDECDLCAARLFGVAQAEKQRENEKAPHNPESILQPKQPKASPKRRQTRPARRTQGRSP